MENKIIYLDNSATTNLCPEAIHGISRAVECFANPSSLHAFGHESEKLMNEERANVSSALGIRNDSHAVIFTSGGSEANNLAVKGIASSKNYKNPKIIISDSEHACIMEPCDELSRKGFEICKLSTKNGKIDLDEFRREMTENVILVSVMLVNNETGAIYPVREIFDIAHAVNPSVICHTDAVQAFLKIKFTVKSIGADMITVSSHKIHGPKGCGALIVDRKILTKRQLSPIISGGGQELNLRSGTENVIGISGFGEAAKAGSLSFNSDYEKMSSLRRYIISNLPDEISLNSAENSAPHILNITLPDIKSETMLHFLSSKGICVSSGSACSSHGKHGSYVLTSFGLDSHAADCSIRVSLSADNTTEDADALILALREGLSTLVRIHR